MPADPKLILKKYIKESRLSGLDDKAITDALLSQGWPQEQVTQALAKQLPSTTEPDKTWKSVPKLFRILGLAGGGLVLLVFANFVIGSGVDFSGPAIALRAPAMCALQSGICDGWPCSKSHECYAKVGPALKQPRVCDAIDSTASYELLKTTCYVDSSEPLATESAKVCEDYNQTFEGVVFGNNIDLAGQCYAAFATNLRDPDVCNEAGTPEGIGACYAGLAKHMLMGRINNIFDWQVCLMAPDVPGSSGLSYRDACLHDIALALPDVTPCDAITDQATKNLCITKAPERIKAIGIGHDSIIYNNTYHAGLSNQKGYRIRINLGYKNPPLESLPPEVYDMENIIVLLGHNNSLGEIPDSISRLPNLLSLYLPNNQISYVSPEIANLPELRYLNLEHNPLPPEEVAKLRSLLPNVELIF